MIRVVRDLEEVFLKLVLFGRSETSIEPKELGGTISVLIFLIKKLELLSNWILKSDKFE